MTVLHQERHRPVGMVFAVVGAVGVPVAFWFAPPVVPMLVLTVFAGLFLLFGTVLAVVGGGKSARIEDGHPRACSTPGVVGPECVAADC